MRLCRAVALFAEARLNGGPKSSINVGMIEGGTSINAIPPLARAKVDIRSESNEKMDELVDTAQRRRGARRAKWKTSAPPAAR